MFEYQCEWPRVSFVYSFIIEKFFQVLYKYKKETLFIARLSLKGHLKYFCLLKGNISFLNEKFKNSIFLLFEFSIDGSIVVIKLSK